MSRRREEEEGKVTLKVAGIEQGISAITGISCTVTKIQIDDVIVPVSGGTVELRPNKTIAISVTYNASIVGIDGDWFIGITCKTSDGQFGWDPTQHSGSGSKTNTAGIGNIKTPASGSITLVIKWYGCAGTYGGVTPPG